MSFFVYFNTESNKFNFIQGDGQLQISNGQPVVKTNTVEIMGFHKQRHGLWVTRNR